MKFSVFNYKVEYLNNIEQVKKDVYDYLNSLEEDKIIISQEFFFQKPALIKFFKELFPNAKIFLVIREQADWLESRFSQLAKSGGSWETEELLRRLAFNCNWLEAYQDYVKTFGKDNVLILPMEKLKQNRDGFLDEFYNFTGIERFYPDDNKVNPKFYNKGYSRASFFIAKSLNRFLNHEQKLKLKHLLLRRLDKYLSWSGRNMIDKKYKKLIKIYYEESNSTLSKTTGINLEKYGYVVNKSGNFEKLKKINYQKYIDNLAEKYKNKKIVVYGAGSFFEYVIKNYDLNGLNITAISDKKFQGTNEEMYMNYRAISPYEIAEYNPDVVFSGIYDPYITNQVRYFIEELNNKKFTWEELSEVGILDKLKPHWILS